MEPPQCMIVLLSYTYFNGKGVDDVVNNEYKMGKTSSTRIYWEWLQGCSSH